MGIQQGMKAPPKPVDTAYQDTAKATNPGILQQPTARRPLTQWQGSTHAIIAIFVSNRELIQLGKLPQKIPLSTNGTTLGLIF